MPKTKHKKKSAAFQSLVKAHKKGPKRCTLYTERMKDGIDPLLLPKKTKHIQLIIDDGYEPTYTCVVVLNTAFKKMSLSRYKKYTMFNDRLITAARHLVKTFEALNHNDRVLERVREMKLDIGRCLVVAGKFKVPDATLCIVEKKNRTRHVFREVRKPMARVEVEYM